VRNVAQITPLIAFPHSAAEKCSISAHRKTTVRSHCTTDVQPMHSNVRRPAVPSFHIICRPFAKEEGSFWGDVCKTVRSRSVVRLSVCPVLSVCELVYCSQMVGWIKMSLGTKGGVGPGDTVLDGDPSPPKNGHSPHFPTHAYCGQTAGWIKMPLGTDV